MLATGGDKELAEIVGEWKDECQIPNMPSMANYKIASIFLHQGRMIHCGGNINPGECFVLENGNWSHHSFLTKYRSCATAVSMKDKVYIFGGEDSTGSSEFLSHDSEDWQEGPSAPDNILAKACGARISDNELLIIGGNTFWNRIIKLTTEDNKWHQTNIQLQDGRSGGHACILFNNKVIITGGIECSKSTEIIDLRNGDLLIRKGGDLQQARVFLGMGIVTVNNTPTLIAFGGQSPSG